MPKIIVSYEFASEAEAVQFLSGGQGKSVPTPSAGATATVAPPVPTAAPAGAPTPPVSVPSGPPATAPAAPPPPPAPVAATANPKIQEGLTAMQAYAGVHKATGVKKVLGVCGLTQITQATPEQLEWLIAAFKSNNTPEALGAK